MVKDYYYKDIDGDHFPDTVVGSELYYTVDASCWLTQENDTITGATWEVGAGITLLDNFIQGTLLQVKLGALKVGSHSAVLTLTTTDNGNNQTKKVPMILKVY